MSSTFSFRAPEWLTAERLVRAPITVKNHDLEVVSRTSLGGTATLGPGAYAATAVLPDGRELTAAFRVSDEAGSGTIELKEARSGRRTLSDTASLDPFLKLRSFDLDQPESDKAEPRFQLLELDPAGGPPRPLRDLPSWVLPDQAGEVRIEPTARQLLVRTVHAGRSDINVRLPVSPSEAAWLKLPTAQDPRLRVRLDDEDAELLLTYFAGGRLAELSTLAKELLRDKARRPVAAAVGGYVLCSIGPVDEGDGASGGSRWLDQWTENLLQLHPWLVDGLCIRAEVLARRGLHERSLAVLLDLPERGVPMFSLGLRFALERLTAYARLMQIGKLPDSHRREVEAILERLGPLAAFADFQQQLLTFKTGADGKPGADRTIQIGGIF